MDATSLPPRPIRIRAAPDDERRLCLRRAAVGVGVGLVGLVNLASFWGSSSDEAMLAIFLLMQLVLMSGLGIVLWHTARHFRTTHRFEAKGWGDFIGTVIAIYGVSALLVASNNLVVAIRVGDASAAQIMGSTGLIGAMSAGATGAWFLRGRILRVVAGLMGFVALALPHLAADQTSSRDVVRLVALLVAVIPSLVGALAEAARATFTPRDTRAAA